MDAFHDRKTSYASSKIIDNTKPQYVNDDTHGILNSTYSTVGSIKSYAQNMPPSDSRQITSDFGLSSNNDSSSYQENSKRLSQEVHELLENKHLGNVPSSDDQIKPTNVGKVVTQGGVLNSSRKSHDNLKEDSICKSKCRGHSVGNHSESDAFLSEAGCINSVVHEGTSTITREFHTLQTSTDINDLENVCGTYSCDKYVCADNITKPKSTLISLKKELIACNDLGLYQSNEMIPQDMVLLKHSKQLQNNVETQSYISTNSKVARLQTTNLSNNGNCVPAVRPIDPKISEISSNVQTSCPLFYKAVLNNTTAKELEKQTNSTLSTFTSTTNSLDSGMIKDTFSIESTDCHANNHIENTNCYIVLSNEASTSLEVNSIIHPTKGVSSSSISLSSRLPLSTRDFVDVILPFINLLSVDCRMFSPLESSMTLGVLVEL